MDILSIMMFVKRWMMGPEQDRQTRRRVLQVDMLLVLDLNQV